MTPKQERFVLEYLIDGNAAGAARRAGYSANSAEIIGFENLRKPKIAAAIKILTEERAEKLGIDAEWVLRKSKQLYHDCVDAEDHATTRSTIEMIGKHVTVKAWDDKKTLEHTGHFQVVSAIEGAPGSEAD